MLKIINTFRKFNFINRSISTNYILRDSENQRETKPRRKIKETVELITLVDQNDKILGLKPKTESEKLAKKLNLSLERVTDTRFGKVYPAYKLISNTEFLKSESKTSTAKTLKKLPLNARISDHDLKVKMQIVKKWIDKNSEVHIAITGNAANASSMKNVFNTIQEEMKECRIIDIRQKEGVLKFILLPPKETPSSK